MAKTTRISYKGHQGTVRRAPSLYNTKPYQFYPDWIAGLPNRDTFIPLSQAELDEARAKAHHVADQAARDSAHS